MLDHSPVMCRSHTQILLSLSKTSPIHQLTFPGNFRLGHHGHMLVDQHPIDDPSELPDWVPSQRAPLQDPTNEVNRILLKRESHSFEATIRIVTEQKQAQMGATPWRNRCLHGKEEGTSFIPSHRSLDTIPSEIGTRSRRLLAREPQGTVSPDLDSPIRGTRRTPIRSRNLPPSRLRITN